MGVNVLVFIHGIVPESTPMDHVGIYREFWEAMVLARPGIQSRVDRQIHVTWGCEEVTQPPPLRNDQLLTQVQQELVNRSSYDNVKKHPGPGNEVMGGLNRDGALPWWSVTRLISGKLRENLIIPGIGDVIYYTSAGGEEIVRAEVYKQVLGGLGGLSRDEVRLHLVGHSLGVTISHDFLYGLFAPGDLRPGFVSENEADPEVQNQYFNARQEVQSGAGLSLGSLTSMASQLPLFVMRVPKLVEAFYRDPGYGIDPADIGIAPGPEDQAKWQLFYDIDDPLAFCTRNLYQPNGAIREVQVDCGDSILTTHSNYWSNPTVIAETAALIEANC